MHLTVFSLGLLVIYIGLMLWGGYETIAGWVAILVRPCAPEPMPQSSVEGAADAKHSRHPVLGLVVA